jgi:hypothetical protein
MHRPNSSQRGSARCVFGVRHSNAASVHMASNPSYMICRPNRNAQPSASSIHGAALAIHGRLGNSRRASSETSTSWVPPINTSSTRGQMSLTPNTNQPAWISQNSSGAFSL